MLQLGRACSYLCASSGTSLPTLKSLLSNLLQTLLLTHNPTRPPATGLGDLANARALFERALTDTPPDTAPQLWDAFLRFEYEVGTMAAIQVGGRGRQRAEGVCGVVVWWHTGRGKVCPGA